MVKRRRIPRLRATHGFAVLFGATGTKNFKTLTKAKKFAKAIAKKKPRSEVVIDGLTRTGQFPHSFIQKDILDRPKKKKG